MFEGGTIGAGGGRNRKRLGRWWGEVVGRGVSTELDREEGEKAGIGTLVFSEERALHSIFRHV